MRKHTEISQVPYILWRQVNSGQDIGEENEELTQFQGRLRKRNIAVDQKKSL